MIKALIKIANELDKKGLRKEADYLDAVMRKSADSACGPGKVWNNQLKGCMSENLGPGSTSITTKEEDYCKGRGYQKETIQYNKCIANYRKKKAATDRGYRLLKESHPRDLWGGRYRDQWYDDDRGGNDEGYHYRDCPTCGCQTEHESTSTGNFCIPCDDKARERLSRKRDKED